MEKRKQTIKKRWNKLTAAALLLVLFLIILIKFITVENYISDYLIASYSLVVSLYAFLRFGLSYLYVPDDSIFDHSYLPTVTIAIPAKNEVAGIYDTIMRCVSTDYPTEKLEIIAINDGSTDDTRTEMRRASRDCVRLGVKTNIVDWRVNRGKREAMVEAVRRARSEIIVFVDSDSYIETDTLRELVKYFPVDPKIGGVTAQTYVSNLNHNVLTALQSLHYYISFKVFKSTESIFGTVTCCPGCCSAYRLGYLKENVEEWGNEIFLGVKCTFGDDRSVTNYLLKRGYKTVFSPKATAYTAVPEKLRQFFKQQLRWKKSWARETILASKFFWKKNPLMAFIFYLGMVLTFLTPVVVIRALLIYPVTTGLFAYSYFLGLLLSSIFLSLYYRMHTGLKGWHYGIFYSFFYSLFLSWQLVYAFATIRNQSWGTR